MAAELHYNLGVVLLQNVEVSLRGGFVPQLKVSIPRSSVDVTDRDELAGAVLTELRFKPIELSLALGRSVDVITSFRVIEQSVDGEDGDLFCQVDPVEASIVESFFDLVELRSEDLTMLVSREHIKPEVVDELVEQFVVFQRLWVIVVLTVVVSELGQDERIWELLCEHLDD